MKNIFKVWERYDMFIILYCVIAVAAAILFYMSELKSKDNQKTVTKTVIKYKTKIVYKYKIQHCKGAIVTITEEDLNNDLVKRYAFISKTKRDEILNSIFKYSKQYQLPSILVYSLVSVESSFRWWITHPKVRGQKDRAIGLGGVMFRYWGKQLKQRHIIETKTDLYSISNNIEAICYILNNLKQQPLKKGTKDKTTSALRRYFGGNFKFYSQRIKDKISQIALDKILNMYIEERIDSNITSVKN